MNNVVGTPSVFAGSATTTPVAVLFVNEITNKPSYAREIAVSNTGANPLKVFFPGNANPMTVPANTERRYNGLVHRVDVASSTGTTTYEIMATMA